MDNIIDNIKIKAGETAAAVGRKASDVYEITKLKVAIIELRGNVKSLFREVGELMYEAHVGGEDCTALVESKFEEITKNKEEIADLEEKLNVIKNVKICAACGASMANDYTFCPKCGVPCAE